MDITIDDASPLISYYSKSGGWVDDHTQGTSGYDPNVASYSMRTFHATMVDGDYVEFRFNGTAIAVYGAKRFNHGVYGVVVDGEAEEFFSGYSGPPTFQQELYKAGGLAADKEHVITVINHPTMRNPTPSEISEGFLDIDHIVVTIPGDDQMYMTTIEDDDPAVTYGSTNWNTVRDPNFHGGTTMAATEKGASMTVQFNGSSIQFFGGLNTDHGNYTVSIDGGSERTFDAVNWDRLYQVPKYLVSGLEDTQHTMKVTNVAQSGYPTFGFDYAVVRSSVPPSNGTVSSADESSQPDTSTASGGDKSVNVGAIAGGVIGGVVGLALVAVLAWYLFRPRRRKTSQFPPRPPSHQRSLSPPPMSFVGYPASSSPGSDFEPKFPRTRVTDAAPTESESRGEALPSITQRFRSVFGRSRTRSGNENAPGDARSPSPEGSVAYFYAPDPNSIPAALSPQAQDDGTILRPPPSDLPRSADSRGSVTSTYYPEDTPASQRTGMAVGPRPTSIPSFSSFDGSSGTDYSHIPLPPLPRLDTVNLPPRPSTSHTERSSVLLPSTAVQTPITSGRTFGQGAGTTSSTPARTDISNSPQSPPTTGSTAPTSTSGGPIPSDYKASLLNLPYPPSPATATTNTADTTTSPDISGSVSRPWRQRIEVPTREQRISASLVSPPPDYHQATQASLDGSQGSRGQA
ncbi:hypothetical protein I317_07220 [Kwoniella heveanensis CBS 569]|nr:hypothetical protein I317_07220 [Kwoniella heveanensis CBS 569]